MKQLEVQIMGQSYLLGCPEGGEVRLQDAVHRVDAAMCKIRDAGKVRARDRIAVLAALNLAFDLADKPVTDAPTEPVTQPLSIARSPAAPAGPATARTASASTNSNSTTTATTANPHLTALLARLDDVLHEDGQLL